MRLQALLGVVGTALLATSCGGDGSTAPRSTISSIVFQQSAIELGVGAALKPNLEVRDLDGALIAIPTGIEWKSSNTALVTVDATGTMRGIALGGPVTVTATLSSKSATTTVTVAPAQIAITPAVTSLGIGESVQLHATAYDAAGNALSVGAPTWTVHSFNATASVTITAGGLLTAVAEGPFELVASMGGGQIATRLGVRSPLDGTWGGTGSSGRLVGANVTFGIVTYFRVANIVVQGCVTLETSANVTGPIAERAFSFRFTPTGTFGTPVSGTINDDGTMSGTYGSLGLGLIACTPENGGSLGQRNLIAGTFTLTKQ